MYRFIKGPFTTNRKAKRAALAAQKKRGKGWTRASKGHKQ